MTNVHDRASESLARPSGGPLAAPAAPDPLSDVLRAVRLTGASFFLWDVSWPYVTPIPDGSTFAPIILPGAQQMISYHIMMEGSAWASLPGHEPTHLEAGDILVIPQGSAYVMSSSPEACAGATVELEPALDFFRRMAAGELPFVVEDGGGGDISTRVVCGFLGCDERPFNPAIAAMPPLVRLPAPTDSTADRLPQLLELALSESREAGPGSQAILLRLSELMFVEVLRRCVATLPAAEPSWLGALRDPVVGPVLVLLHRSPEKPWTLEALAEAVGISRSQLADRFARWVGEPPMHYLSRWRIQLATRLLAEKQSLKIAAVAREVGYASEAAFSRAFKRCVGVSPADWRRGSGSGSGSDGGGSIDSGSGSGAAGRAETAP